jgi:hypothetical protein
VQSMAQISRRCAQSYCLHSMWPWAVRSSSLSSRLGFGYRIRELFIVIYVSYLKVVKRCLIFGFWIKSWVWELVQAWWIFFGLWRQLLLLIL